MFSDTLTDEKDPTVRAYTENLRGQVATIAAKYGVNARDVFRADVQERMEVDDLAAVAALVKRIGMFSKDRIPAKESEGLRFELNRRERAAREMLAEVEGMDVGNKDEVATVIRLMIAGKFLVEASTLANRALIDDPQLLSEMYSAMAVSAFASNPDYARSVLGSAMDMAKKAWRNSNRIQPYLDAYGVELGLRSDDEVETESAGLMAETIDAVPVFLARLTIELSRRNIPEDNQAMGRLTRLSRAARIGARNVRGRVDDCLVLAVLYGENGLYSDPELRKAVDCAKDLSQNEKAEAVRAIAEVAGMTGNSALVDQLQKEDWWRTADPVNLDFSVADGALRAKRFDQAIAFLAEEKRNDRTTLFSSSFAYRLLEALLDADEIARAERFKAEFMDASGSTWSLWDVPEYAAARARRGDDVLAKVREQFTDSPTSFVEDSAPAFAGAAIATIGFTTAMKKRLGL